MNAASPLVVGVVLGALAVGCESTVCPAIGVPNGIAATFEERFADPGEYRLVVESSLGEGVCSLRIGAPDGAGGAGGAAGTTSGASREGECIGELGDLGMFLDESGTLTFSFALYTPTEDLPEEMVVVLERDGAALFEETIALDYETFEGCSGEEAGARAEVTLR